MRTNTYTCRVLIVALSGWLLLSAKSAAAQVCVTVSDPAFCTAALTADCPTSDAAWDNSNNFAQAAQGMIEQRIKDSRTKETGGGGSGSYGLYSISGEGHDNQGALSLQEFKSSYAVAAFMRASNAGKIRIERCEENLAKFVECVDKMVTSSCTRLQEFSIAARPEKPPVGARFQATFTWTPPSSTSKPPRFESPAFSLDGVRCTGRSIRPKQKVIAKKPYIINCTMADPGSATVTVYTTAADIGLILEVPAAPVLPAAPVPATLAVPTWKNLGRQTRDVVFGACVNQATLSLSCEKDSVGHVIYVVPGAEAKPLSEPPAQGYEITLSRDGRQANVKGQTGCGSSDKVKEGSKPVEVQVYRCE